MVYQIIFVFGIIALIISMRGQNTRKKVGNIRVRRSIYPDRITEGEEFNITLKVENRNKAYVPYLIVREKIPCRGLSFVGNVNEYTTDTDLNHISRYSLDKMQRKTRTYRVNGDKRGAYLIKTLDVTVGDKFGVAVEEIKVYDFLEVVVYPKVKDIATMRFENNNFQGENSVRRWIHKDPMYIKGIREYTVNDRMKDIHWKSSLKANKLMVKEFDYTSNEQIFMIISIQFNNLFWKEIDENLVERAINIAVSFGAKAFKEGLEIGIGSNAQCICLNDEQVKEVPPVSGNFNMILEYCARISNMARYNFSEYLKSIKGNFKRGCTYIILAFYMEEETINIIGKLVSEGINIKLIDISKGGILPDIRGVEKVVYKEEY